MKKLASKLNSILFKLTKKILPVHVYAFPDKMCIDASTICNLKCVKCPTGQNLQGISKGYLKFKDFKKFIDKYHPHINHIFLSNKGEIFLNPEICKIIEYAQKKNINVAADTTLNYLNKEMAENIVKSKMGFLRVSIDGATNKTYRKYRVGGDLNKVILNIKMINRYKRMYNSEYPILRWKFILFNHNKHEISKAKSMAKKLNMNFWLVQNWSENISKKDIVNRENIKEKLHKHRKNYCYQLWDYPVINYNGNLLGCCAVNNERLSLGNVFKKDFFKTFNNKKIKKIRRWILKKSNYYSNPCLKCPIKKADLINIKSAPSHIKKWSKFKIQIFSLHIPFKLTFASVFHKMRHLFRIISIVKWPVNRILGLIGIFLKKHFPPLYFEIRKIKKKLGLK